MRVIPSLLRSRVVALAGLALAVGLLCWLSALMFVGDPGMSAVWPANAVALAFILRACRGKDEARTALAVATLAMIGANILVGRPPAAALLFPLANALEIAIAAWFMRAVAMPMTAPGNLGQFVLGGVLAGPMASMLAASAAAAGLMGLSGQALADFALGWLLSDALGMAIVAPFLLSLTLAGRQSLLRVVAGPTLVFLIAFALCWQARAPILFLSFPLVTLAVLNDRGRGGALAVGAVAAAVILSAWMGQGPALRLEAGGLDPVAVLQIFFAALVMTAHPLAAALTRLDMLAAQEQTLRLAAEAESAAKTETLGRVGEGIRSPLSGVVTVAQMLRSGRLGDLNARQLDLLTRIAESGAEIEALSREMTAIAKGREPGPRGVGVADIVVEVGQAASFRANGMGVRIELLAGDAAWTADIEPARLRRILTGAVSAALDAAGEGGCVRIVAGLRDAGGLEIAVEDSGETGLTTRLDAFQRDCADPDAPPGLAVDRDELRRLGGDLELSRGALGGCRLILSLPRAGADRVAA